MSNLFKTNTGRSTPVPMDTQLRIQSSVQGLPRPIGYGATRISGNLIWYGDFEARAIQQSPTGAGGKGGSITGGGKGGGGQTTGYNYFAAVAIALAEGPISQVLTSILEILPIRCHHLTLRHLLATTHKRRGAILLLSTRIRRVIIAGLHT